MIYVSQPDISERDFTDLLERTRGLTLNDPSISAGNKIDGLQFEELTYKKACEAAVGSPFDGSIERTGALTFPDIIARKFYGIEVKATTADKWVSTGNSVLETTRVPGVERIYMFFGKLGGSPDIKYRPYQDCLSEVGVTHSPRYMINMQLAQNASIFDKIGVTYDELRNDKGSIKRIKQYYRSQLQEGEELWWIDDISEEVVEAPIIKPYSSLSTEEKHSFVTEAMALFPEIFGSSSVKFERVAAFMVTSRNVVSSNIRDIFTAGGQRSVALMSEDTAIPQIFYKLHEHASDIENYLKGVNREHVENYWRGDWQEQDIIKEWKRRVDYYSNSQLSRINASGSLIFDKGVTSYGEKI